MSNEKFSIVTGPIRSGAMPVHIYNDGLTVFLYDETLADHIREADPKIIWFAGAEAFADPTSQSLLTAGELLVYGLHGDGGVDVEVVVGPPLTDAELAIGRWYPTEEGFLQLPSGRLCIHSYNTLPMGDNGDDPADVGGLVEVLAGQYKVHLYRKNWEEMEAADVMNLAWASDAGIDIYRERIDEVIVLSQEEPAGASSSNILFRYCIE